MVQMVMRSLIIIKYQRTFGGSGKISGKVIV